MRRDTEQVQQQKDEELPQEPILLEDSFLLSRQLPSVVAIGGSIAICVHTIAVGHAVAIAAAVDQLAGGVGSVGDVNAWVGAEEAEGLQGEAHLKDQHAPPVRIMRSTPKAPKNGKVISAEMF